MNLIINVGNIESAKENINKIKDNNYAPFDIRITNTHIVNLNKKIGKTIFRKDALYINSNTLCEIMHEGVGHGTHNYHGLTANDIICSLQNISNPSLVFKSKFNRLAILTITLSHFDEPILIVIELGAPLRGKINANIYKIVTMYPKSNIDAFIDKTNKGDIIYKIKK